MAQRASGRRPTSALIAISPIRVGHIDRRIERLVKPGGTRRNVAVS